METQRIPDEGNIRQLNVGDIQGEIWASRCIDLSTSPGKIKLARPVEEVMSGSDLDGDPVEAIEFYSGNFYTLTDNNLYSSTSQPYDTWSVATSSVTSGEDMATYDGKLFIVDGTDIGTWDGSTYDDDYWTAVISGSALTSGVPHILDVVRASGRDTLVVTDNNSIRYYNSTDGHTQITWDDDLIACCHASGLTSGWVGTYTESGGSAEVIRWQVGNDQYTQAYPSGSSAVLSIDVLDNIPYIVTERGEIKKFNQAGFTTIATLPIFNEPAFLDGVETGLIQVNNTGRPIHPKGLRKDGDNLLLLVKTKTTDGSVVANSRTLSGVWEINPQTGSCTLKYTLNGDVVADGSGPVFVTNDPNGRVYFGAEKLPVSTTNTDERLFREDLSGTTNYGHFVMTEFHSEGVEDYFSSTTISALQDENDKVVVKYRSSKSLSLPVIAEGSWLNSNTFNTTTDLSNVQVGHEMEVLSDSGAGRCTHITEIATSASTYSVTVEDRIGTAGSDCRAQFDNWEKLDDYDTTQSVKSIGINHTGTMMQLKVYMEGSNGNPEINRLVNKSVNKHPLK